jgi:hypothetical protein
MLEFWYEYPEGVVGLHPHLKLLPYVALTLKYRVLKDVLKVAVSVFSTFEE